MDDDRPTKVCSDCKRSVIKEQFAKRQWKRQDPVCRWCTEEKENLEQQQHMQQTKICKQCGEKKTKDQCSKNQWKKKDEQPTCVLCYELTKISDKKTRRCKECKVKLPRDHFSFFQWGRGKDALCHSCSDVVTQRILESMGDTTQMKDLPDGTTVCAHDRESCDVCMVDFRLPNLFERKRTAEGATSRVMNLKRFR